MFARCFVLLLIPTALTGQRAVPRAEARRIAAFPEPFSLIRGVRELSTGVVLVTDWTEERLVALDFGHGTATEIGRVGRGPDEFRLPAQLVALGGDSTLLVDVGNARLAVIGPDLAIHRTMPAQRPGTPYAVMPRGADAARGGSTSASRPGPRDRPRHPETRLTSCAGIREPAQSSRSAGSRGRPRPAGSGSTGPA